MRGRSSTSNVPSRSPESGRGREGRHGASYTPVILQLYSSYTPVILQLYASYTPVFTTVEC